MKRLKWHKRGPTGDVTTQIDGHSVWAWKEGILWRVTGGLGIMLSAYTAAGRDAMAYACAAAANVIRTEGVKHPKMFGKRV